MATYSHYEDEVYVAMHSTPDYSSPPPSFKSLHRTLLGAIQALYPDMKDTSKFRENKWPSGAVWQGPDGYGLIRVTTIKD